MAASIPDITVPKNEFVDLNTLANIPVGEVMFVQNKGAYTIILQESTLKPADDSEDGVAVGNMYNPYATADIKAGSIRLWARAIGGDCKISVQRA